MASLSCLLDIVFYRLSEQLILQTDRLSIEFRSAQPIKISEPDNSSINDGKMIVFLVKYHFPAHSFDMPDLLLLILALRR